MGVQVIIKKISLKIRRKLKKINEEKFLEDLYYVRMGEKLDLDHPETYNEKLQWLKLNDRKDIYSIMVDKVEAKKYVASIIGEKHIIPTLCTYDNVQDLKFEDLPDKFVIKCNHNSGLGMYICRSRDAWKQDKEIIINNLQKGLKQDYYRTSLEWPYKNVRRKILVEQYMENSDKTELVDYKVMCFEGEPKLIEVIQNRSTTPTQDFYDVFWNKTEISESDMPVSDSYMQKPFFLDEMLEFSRKLSKGLHHLRVDWYYINGNLYFGELTFYDGAGFDRFSPSKYEQIMGDWIKLPTDEKR